MPRLLSCFCSPSSKGYRPCLGAWVLLRSGGGVRQAEGVFSTVVASDFLEMTQCFAWQFQSREETVGVKARRRKREGALKFIGKVPRRYDSQNAADPICTYIFLGHQVVAERRRNLLTLSCPLEVNPDLLPCTKSSGDSPKWMRQKVRRRK